MHAIDPNKTHRKCRRLPNPRLLGTDPMRIPHLTGLLDTYIDKKHKAVINNLRESWQDIIKRHSSYKTAIDNGDLGGI
jgi:hypothetical protein